MFKNQKELVLCLFNRQEIIIVGTDLLYKVINETLYSKRIGISDWQECLIFPQYDTARIFNEPKWFEKCISDEDYYDEDLKIKPIFCWLEDDASNRDFSKKNIDMIGIVTKLRFEEGSFSYYIDNFDRYYNYALPLTKEELFQYLFDKETLQLI
ncbi:hypothetical protein [Flavobacterium sp.]|uniref:hypothetical protein n=1 Tax=Flavobacterium sp. TaxID=239 RepID=UPI002605B595|nr:hypothetical protein [Flavobacterium sp.]